MKVSSITQIICTYTLLLNQHATKVAFAKSQHPTLVVIGYDGFRPDYLNRGLTPTLAKFVRDGVSTDYLQNVFPTKTMTNFFSIATGMYAETHGVLGNSVFNEKRECLYYGHELYHYTNVTPIWTLNELMGDGRHSGVMMWGGGEFEFNDVLPTYFEPYNKSEPWHERINRTLEWLLDDKKPVNLLFIYFEQPDSAGHYYGIQAPEFNEQLKRVDDIFDYFLQELARNGLKDKVDIIVLSDHGMVNIDRAHLTNVTQYISSTDSKYCGTPPVIQVATNNTEKHVLYNQMVHLQRKLGTFKVYKQHEIPESWHFKHNNRNTELLLVGKIPFSFDMDENVGEHGYDNRAPQMRAFFAAKGPNFRKNFHRTSFNNIDIYALISYMLALDATRLEIKPNGTLSDIIAILDREIAADYINDEKRSYILDYFVPKTSAPPLARLS